MWCAGEWDYIYYRFSFTDYLCVLFILLRFLFVYFIVVVYIVREYNKHND